jgi:hypothetical protein
MMVEELGIMPPEDTWAAAKGGVITFCSFLFFGCIPLVVYVITAIALGTEKSAEKVRIQPEGLSWFIWRATCTQHQILALARSTFAESVNCARVSGGI